MYEEWCLNLKLESMEVVLGNVTTSETYIVLLTSYIFLVHSLNDESPTFQLSFRFLAVWTGLEPATPCVTGMYSNQLNYQTVNLVR
jgi:hypothetical protein